MTVSTNTILGLATTAVGAAGLLTIPAPAQAIPPMPLGPACTDWRLNDGAQAFDTASGDQVYVPWTQGTGEVRQSGDAALVSPDANLKGSAYGGIDKTGVVEVTVRWNNGGNFNENTPWIHFRGNLNDLGVLSGTANDSKGVSQPFTARTPYNCAATQGPPANPAAPAKPDAPTGPVTNAISPNFDGSSNTTFKVTLKNSSKLPATCNYEAVSQNAFIPSDTTRTFDVPPNSSHTEGFDGTKTGTDYTITITCNDSSGTQTEPLGSINQTVKW